MNAPLALFWHRRDLRLVDHQVIAQVLPKTPRIVGLLCFDPQLLKSEDLAPARIAYLLGCLAALAKDYERLGSRLLFFTGDPTLVLPTVTQQLDAKLVAWSLDTEPYAQERDHAVAQGLREKGVSVITDWDQLLHHPGEVLTQAGKPYTVFTPFWKNWSKQPKPAIAASPKALTGLSTAEAAALTRLDSHPLPSLEDLGFAWSNPLPLDPGTDAAQERLRWFQANVLTQYQETRNYPAIDGTSQLSAALKFGVISIRTLWQTTEETLATCRSDEERDSVITWQQELAWREFYQHCLYTFPRLLDGPYRDAFRQFPWENNPQQFQAWCRGTTGYPIVDAAMHQLNETGWMHNRCRMIVASFLTKDLILNWQLGERYFMQTLYDGDAAANNGGWQWSASSGMDPKPLRIFNPHTQAQKYDPEGEYIRRWLPELAGFDTGDLLTGKLTPMERQSVGYPMPIVDHAIQQRQFKQRYQQAKETS